MAFRGPARAYGLYDRVTDLLNRRRLRAQVAQAIARIKREGRTARIFFDVDDFKIERSVRPSRQATMSLRMVAERLKKTTFRRHHRPCRRATIRGHPVWRRYAGERGGRCRQHDPIRVIAEPFPTEPIESHVGLSIGVTMIPVDSDDPDTLLRCSDMAMYVAKSRWAEPLPVLSEEINNSSIQRQLEIRGRPARGAQDRQRGLVGRLPASQGARRPAG